MASFRTKKKMKMNTTKFTYLQTAAQMRRRMGSSTKGYKVSESYTQEDDSILMIDLNGNP